MDKSPNKPNQKEQQAKQEQKEKAKKLLKKIASHRHVMGTCGKCSKQTLANLNPVSCETMPWDVKEQCNSMPEQWDKRDIVKFRNVEYYMPGAWRRKQQFADTKARKMELEQIDKMRQSVVHIDNMIEFLTESTNGTINKPKDSTRDSTTVSTNGSINKPVCSKDSTSHSTKNGSSNGSINKPGSSKDSTLSYVTGTKRPKDIHTELEEVKILHKHLKEDLDRQAVQLAEKNEEIEMLRATIQALLDDDTELSSSTTSSSDDETMDPRMLGPLPVPAPTQNDFPDFNLLSIEDNA